MKNIVLSAAESPCMKCQERIVGCHADCRDYAEYHSEREAEASIRLQAAFIKADYIAVKNTAFNQNLYKNPKKYIKQ